MKPALTSRGAPPHRELRTREGRRHDNRTRRHPVARASAAAGAFLERMGVRVDRPSLIRGALLHDYFLYDWHDPDPSHRLHGFTHPAAALARALEDFELTERERNIIARHMFPLVPIPPTCREAWIVCMADKACALHETIAARLPGRRGGRTACA